MPKTATPSKRRSKATVANETVAFKDINPAFRPTDVPPMDPISRSSKPDLRLSRSQSGAPAANQYPTPTPASPPMRTQGEDSISTERVTLSVRMRFNPLRGLTPERYVDYVDQFWIGFFRQAAVMWDKMELRDPVIKSVAPKRKKSVARHGFEILLINDIPEGMETLAQAQKETLQHFYNNLTATDAVKPDEQGGLSLLTRQMMDAQCKYYAVHEIVWQPSPDGLTAQFVFCPLWWFEGVTGKLRYLDNEFQVYGRDMAASEWLVTCGEGLMEAAGVARTFMTLSLTDWLGYTEKFGQAFIDAATSASPGSAEWEKLKEYVQNFGPDGGGVRSNSATINLLQPSNASNVDAFYKMVEHMEKQIVVLFRGSDLGTHAKANMTGASLQGDETSILEDDDCTLIEETLATKVNRFVIHWSHGDVPVLAYIKFNRSDKQNVAQDLSVDQFLVSNGAPVGVRATLERYGRDCPDTVTDDDVLSAPVAPAGPGPEKDKEDPEDPDNPKDPEATQLANASEAAHDLGCTLHEILLPLLKRLQAIANIEDATIQQHLVEKLLKDFPAISDAIAADDSLAKKLSPVLQQNLIAGLKPKIHK